jgi:hypothetical protein
MFAGRSSLRAAETKAPPPVNKALQDYLAKYTSDGDAAKKKRKKKKEQAKANPAGVRILDQDLSGFAAPAAAPDPDEEDERRFFCAAISLSC